MDVKKFNITDDEQFALDLLHEKKISWSPRRGLQLGQPDHFRPWYTCRASRCSAVLYADDAFTHADHVGGEPHALVLMLMERIQEVLPGHGVIGPASSDGRRKKNSDFMMGLIMAGSSCLMLSWTFNNSAEGKPYVRVTIFRRWTMLPDSSRAASGVSLGLILALDCSSGAIRLSFQEEGNAWGANLSNKFK